MWRLERFSDFRHLLASRLAFFELNDEAQPGAGSESQSFLGDAQVLASSRTIRPMSWEEYFIADSPYSRAVIICRLNARGPINIPVREQ